MITKESESDLTQELFTDVRSIFYMFGCGCIYKLLVTQGKNIYQLYKCSIYWLQSYKVSVPESDKEKNDCDIESCSNGACRQQI